MNSHTTSNRNPLNFGFPHVKLIIFSFLTCASKHEQMQNKPRLKCTPISNSSYE